MNTVKMSHIGLISRAMSLFALLVAFVIAASFLFIFVLPGNAEALLRASLLDKEAPVLFSLENSIGVAMVWLPPLAALVYALWHVSRLFALYARLEMFSLTASRTLRKIGSTIIIFVPLQMLAMASSSYLLTRHAPVGEQQVVFGLQTSDLMVLVLGGLLWVVGWVSAEATRINEENQAII